MSNANRDYAIVYDVKNSSLVLSRPLVFYITDQNTSNIFVRLVTKVSVGNGIDQYTDIEEASSYALTMRVIKPNNEVKSIEATQHELESIFQFDLTEDFKDIPGKYICELTISTIVSERQELITSDPFNYEVKRSILSNVSEIIETEDTTVEKLLNNLEASKIRLFNDLELAKTNLHNDLNATNSALNSQIQASDNKLNSRLDATEAELSSRINTTEAELNSRLDTLDTTEAELSSQLNTTKAELSSQLDTTKTEINSQLDTTKAELSLQIREIEKKHENIIYVTNKNYKESITKMRDGYIYNIIENITLDENIEFSNLNNIEFRCNSTIRVSDGFPNSKNVISFNKCNNVLFECKKIDLENKELFDDNGMNFIVLFTDCENVNVINTEIINGMGIKGLSSSVNCVNSTKVGKNLTVNNLTVNNCRSSVFTQYENNTITNVKTYNSNDAIIALNSENCKNSYISNCYADYNTSFPLIAIENNAINVNIENCIARNTRGLLEIFSLENSFIDSYQPNPNTVNISNCSHIINDETFEFNSTVTLITFSFRRGIEKYTNINIDKVDCFNTTTKGSSYLHVLDSNLNGNIIKNLSIKNSYVNIKSIKDYAILFNTNAENIVLKDNKFINGSNDSICVRHTRDSIRIDNLTIEGGYIEGFERAFACDFTYNDFIGSFTMKNTRFINVPGITYNYPNGTITNNDYNIDMFNNEYILSNKGCSRFVFARSKQPPTVGTFFKGDIAINKFNNEEYYYNGTKWIRRGIVGNDYIASADNPSYPPDQVNSIYVNINTKKVYISIGTNSVDDWILLN